VDKENKESKEPEGWRSEDGTQAKSPIGVVNPQAPGAADLVKGQIILDRYKVISLIGRGAMGAVYRVEQLSIRKQVALKTLNPISASDVNVRRFQNEALAASKLEHPNLVRALDYGWLGNQPFMVMDLVEGPTLAQHLRLKTTLTPQSAYQIFIPICFALAYAHQEGVIHRDLKPSNIVLAPSTDSRNPFIPKLVDFGIAKLSTEEEALTKTGEIFGTPLYMSPEQCLGSKVDVRSDIYSLGCVLYEALTGAPPFTGQSALETMMQHKEKVPLPLKQAALGQDFPPALQRVVSKMLEKDPDLRYENFLAVAEDLTWLQQGRSDLVKKGDAATPARKKSALIAAVLAVGLLVVATVGGFVIWPRPVSRTDTDKQKLSESIRPGTTDSATAPAKTVSGNADSAKAPAKTVSDNGDSATAPAKTVSDNGDSATAVHDEAPMPHAGPMSSIVSGQRTFDFGKGAAGQLSIMDNLFGYAKDTKDARGIVSYPKNAPLMFEVSFNQAYNDPHLFEKFKDDDLRALKFKYKGYEDGFLSAAAGRSVSFDNPLSWASHLTSLQYLNFKDAPITMAGLRNLNIEQMHDLRSLTLCATNVDGSVLAQSQKMLRQLELLDVGKVKNVPKVLIAMQKSANIKYLQVATDNLKNSDLAYIASMPNLNQLTLTGNPITDGGLAKLSHLQFLHSIILSRCDQLTPAAAKELAKFPSLSSVFLPAKLKYFENRINHKLPNVQVIYQD